MLEKTVEAYLVERVRALGGTAYKFTSPARASVPDRIVILPPGRIYFVELKRPGGKLTRGQEREHEHLRRLGADVRMLDSIGAINAFLNGVQAVAGDGPATDEPIDIALASVDPCPFCGSESVDPKGWAGNDGRTGPACDECGATAETIEGWNRRAAVSPATADERAARDDGFFAGVCVALQVITAFDQGVMWAELVRACGTDELLQYAAHVEPEEWQLAGFEKYAFNELRKKKPKAAARASQAAAPAEAREPDAYILPYDLEVLKTYSAQCQVTLYREPRKTRVPLYAGRVPAQRAQGGKGGEA
ncbi:hypothetical protein [Burkholderia gladioli]|uniref:hypothetical protein n=1 Tax=Burkholderia gladioli TaxID=28095 RepID=UPI00164128D5|nr:hypothetical protein [Burkholderia gladioli]